MLRNQAEEYQQTVGQFDDDDWDSFGTLIGAAFALAVRQQFGSEHTPAEVVKLVAELRAQFDPDGDSLDPRVFELMVRSALGDKGLKLRQMVRVVAPTRRTAGPSRGPAVRHQLNDRRRLQRPR